MTKASRNVFVVTRAVYVANCDVNHLVRFTFEVETGGGLRHIATSNDVLDPMNGMNWIQGREYIEEIDYQLTQAHMLALGQLEAADMLSGDGPETSLTITDSPGTEALEISPEDLHTLVKHG